MDVKSSLVRMLVGNATDPGNLNRHHPRQWGVSSVFLEGKVLLPCPSLSLYSSDRGQEGVKDLGSLGHHGLRCVSVADVVVQHFASLRSLSLSVNTLRTCNDRDHLSHPHEILGL